MQDTKKKDLVMIAELVSSTCINCPTDPNLSASFNIDTKMHGVIPQKKHTKFYII